MNGQGIPPASQLSRLTRRFRYYLNQMPNGRGILSYAPSMYDYASYEAAYDTAVDFYAIQGNYADAWDASLNSNVNWFWQPLRKPNLCPNADTHAWAEFLPNWTNAGHSVSRLMPMISTSSAVATGSTQLCAAPAGRAGDGYYSFYAWITTHGGTTYWNDIAKEYYITGTATSNYSDGKISVSQGQQFFTVVDQYNGIYAKVAWLDSMNYKGIGLYSFGTDVNPALSKGHRNVVIDTTLQMLRRQRRHKGQGGLGEAQGTGVSVCSFATDVDATKPFGQRNIVSRRLLGAVGSSAP